MNENRLKIPEEGIALCLSGGGFRASLFHLGALWRLNEFGYLSKLDRISSVSGGSIVAGWLGLQWNKLHFNSVGVAQNFIETIVKPLRQFAEKKMDLGLIVSGLLNPFRSVGDYLIDAYRKNLFGNATLQDLPDTPRIVLNASNAQSGGLFRFSKPYIADYRIGMMKNPTVKLAVAVAASSAFPPFLSPVVLHLNPDNFVPETVGALHNASFASKIILMDGGVYDNLGLETIYKRYSTILVSDGGGKMQPESNPKLFWGLQAFRVLTMMDNQVRSLRKQEIVDLFQLREELVNYMANKPLALDHEVIQRVSRRGAYWGTFTNIREYELGDLTLPCPFEKTQELAKFPTRMWTVSKAKQECLINWGYAACDAAMRRYVDAKLPHNAQFPYNRGVG